MDEAETEVATGETGPQTPRIQEMTGDTYVVKQDDAAVTAQRGNTKEKKQTKEDAEKNGKCFPKLREKRKKQTPRRTNRHGTANRKRWRMSTPTRLQSGNPSPPPEDGGGDGLPWQVSGLKNFRAGTKLRSQVGVCRYTKTRSEWQSLGGTTCRYVGESGVEERWFFSIGQPGKFLLQE